MGAIGRARASVAAIRTLATIRAQARTVATDAERVALSGWSGWGPLAKAFAPDDQTWADMAEEIRDALPSEDVSLGMQGTYNAFYTPRPLAEAMWQMLMEFGYDGGPVAELGCGGGVFFSTAPEGVPLAGVERDTTAAAICTLLNPHAQVINKPLEEAYLPGDFAAVIGNVPFGDVEVFDPTAPDDVRDNLHNYFIWRAVQALAPGGYAVVLTSRFTMDSYEFQARSEISKDADFVGALRLPNGALGGGTQAAADIVILRRKGGTDRKTYGHSWQDTTVDKFGWDGRYNKWWDEEPDAVFGRMAKGKTTQYGLGLLVEPTGEHDELPARLLRYVRQDLAPQARKRNLAWVAPPSVEGFDLDASDVVSAEGWHEGSMHLKDGKVLVVVEGKAQPLPKPGAELLRLLKLRDLAVRLLDAEQNYSLSDAAIEPVRADVRAAYQDYVKHHGALNRYTQVAGPVDEETGLPTYRRRYPTMQGFRYDPDSSLVFALEVFDDDAESDDDSEAAQEGATWKATPAPIQLARQNVPPVRHTRTDDPMQALAWCLDRTGGQVDLDYIAELLGMYAAVVCSGCEKPVTKDGSGWRHGEPVDGHDAEPMQDRNELHQRIAGLLGDKVYRDPATLAWITAEEYLSGNVRSKHRAAMQAAEHLPEFGRNVTALEAVLPKWLGPADITANLGTPWIGPKDVQAFIAEVIGYAATVRRVDATNQWEVDEQRLLASSVAASAMWGTPDVSAFKLVQLALNNKTPNVKKVIPDDSRESGYREVKDKDKSMLAAEKQQQLRARFEQWVWEDPDRADRLVKLYNERYNSLVPRRFDGSHISIDGIAPGFVPYAHQLEMVARCLATPATLCGHPVGAGKTNTMAMAAMKLRQVGLVRKPMIVVPNHLIEQVDREIRQLFPAARILVGSSNVLGSGGKGAAGGARRRRSFTARCATQEWDLILVTHTAFNAMDIDPETQALYIRDQEEELYESVVKAGGGRLVGRMVKALAKQLDRMKVKVKELRHAKRGRDAGVRFEQLGVDYLLIDEAHYYKNLSLPVRTEGFSVRPSKRATDLDVKLRYLAGRGKGRYAALFTGTPVSNTMLELYVVMHYTMKPYLKSVGLGSADAWAAAYVQFVTSVEVTIDGQDFEMRTRPALFVNAPELRVMLSQVADIRTADQLGLKRPKSELRIIAVEPTDAQAVYSMDLVMRAEEVRKNGWSPEPGSDNMLAICGDGRRMATDPALVGLDDDGEGKLHAVAARMVEVWRKHPGKLQIGFLDLGTPKQKRGYDGSYVDHQTYGRLRRMLVDAGMDVRRIRFIHDAKDDATKAQLFRDCRRGKVDVILGSTDKLGVGTNIQRLVVAMHHIDAPFRPADVEQRDGRGLRPGNVNKVVTIFRYVTKRTFDAYMWQMLTRKIGFISQMLSGNLDRTVEDVTGDDVMSFAAIKAAATDQPLLMEKAEVESKVKRLRGLERAHKQQVARMRKDGPRMRQEATDNANRAKAWEAIAAAAGTVKLTDEVLKDLHERMGRLYGGGNRIKVGGLEIGWRVWRDMHAEQPEPQPLLTIDGGAGWVEERAFKFWKPGQIKQRIVKVLATAASVAELRRENQAKLLAEADRCDEVAELRFEHADELTAALARLDQIEAALREAASKSDQDKDAIVVGRPAAGDRVTETVERAAEVDDEPDAEPEPDDSADADEFDGFDLDLDLDAMADIAGMVMNDLEAEVAAKTAELFADVDFSMFG